MRIDLEANEEVTTYFAVESLELKKSRKQQRFLALTLADRTGNIKGYYWKDAMVAACALKDKPFVKVKGIVKTVNDFLVMDIEKIRAAERSEIDMGDFLEVVPEGIEHWKKRLHEVVNSINEPHCTRLIGSFLGDRGFLDRFSASPGGVTVHHNYIGGLLQHTTAAMEQAALIAEKYPEHINRDLLMTGAFLHDIGKTRELRYETVREYTTEGKLLGHILIGISMIDEKIVGLPGFPEDLALALKHMIISHHGEPDFGSPVRPATAEALALHIIDNADAKLNHLACHLRNSISGSLWSSFDRFLSTEIYQNGSLKVSQKQGEEVYHEQRK